MNLTEDDIINAIDSYRSKSGLINDDMAPLCGMANGSVYFKWVNKKTESGKIKYLVEFLKNTNQSFNDLFSTASSKQYKLQDEQLGSVKASVEMYSCPDCRPRVTKIKELKEEIANLKEELLQMYRGQAKKETPDEDSTQLGEDVKQRRI